MKFSCIEINCKEVVKVYVDGSRAVTTEHLENPSELWRQLSYKGILKKLKDKGRAWPFYTATKS